MAGAEQDIAQLRQALKPERTGERPVRDHRRAARVPARVQRDPADRPRAAPGDRRPAPLGHAAQRDRAARPLPGAVPGDRRERRRDRLRLPALALGVPPVDGLPGGGVRAEPAAPSCPPAPSRWRRSAGSLVTCLASSVPLLDLRRRAPAPEHLAARTTSPRAPCSATGAAARSRWPRWRCSRSRACSTPPRPPPRWSASVALALATVLAVPVAFGVGARRGTRALRSARRASRRSRSRSAGSAPPRCARSRWPRPARSRCSAASRSAARAATCSPGSVASRTSYAADAPIWVSEPGDNQAHRSARPAARSQARLAALPQVAAVGAFQGQLHDARVAAGVGDRAPARRRSACPGRPEFRRARRGAWRPTAALRGDRWSPLTADRLRTAYCVSAPRSRCPTPTGRTSLPDRRAHDQPRLEPGRDLHGPADYTRRPGRQTPPACSP